MAGKIATRAAYGEALVELAEQYPELVVFDADLSNATMTKGFAAKYPERFFDMGIAECNMTGVAAGMSTCGFKPFTNTFAIFASGRAWEQVRNSIGYPHLNVKVVGELFTPGRLKAYQEWLLSKSLSWNSISTYMRTLRAVFNRIFPVGSSGYIPGLFNDVYTKVESRTKRALTQKQMRLLLGADISLLPEDMGRTLAYFLLMFLFRGMPFIDLAHLRKRDVQGNVLV